LGGTLTDQDTVDIVVVSPATVAITNATVNSTAVTTETFDAGYSTAVVSVVNAGKTGLTAGPTSVAASTFAGLSTPSLALDIPSGNTVAGEMNRKVTVTSNVGNFSSVNFVYSDLQNAASGIPQYGGSAGNVTFYDANNAVINTVVINANTANNAPQTFSWTSPGTAAKYFVITTYYDKFWMDTVNLTAATGAIAGGGTTVDTTPTLNGTLSRALVGAESVRIFEGATDLGAATVSGTGWSFTVPATSVASHTYVAKVMSGGVAQSTSGNFVVNVAATPLVLDLNGDGVQTLGIEQGVQFDLLNTGAKQNVGWVDKHDGLLVMDLNGDGQVNNGSELFGDRTVLADGSHAKDGWAALAAQDSNADGVIDATDANFDKLRVWVDANSDGITDAGELRTLADAHIASINLNHTGGSVQQNGNVVEAASSFTTTDGATHEVADVGFQVQTPAQSAASTDAASSSVYSLTNGASLDLSALSNAALVKSIDMSSDTAANTLKLNLSDVLSVPTTNGVHQLTLTGDANDTVDMDTANWTHTGTTVTCNGHSYAVYNAVTDTSVQLLIDQQLLIV
jgi:hypothetical protein